MKVICLFATLIICQPSLADPPNDNIGKKVIEKKLAQEISIGIEPGPIKEALGYISDRYNIPYMVDKKAFGEKLKTFDAQKVQLKAVTNISIREALQKLLSQAHATFRITDTGIEIIPVM
jgi:hypothetical protein